MNVLRYCNWDESLEEEESLVCYNALERLFRTKELDYMSYIVLRMFENTEVGYFNHVSQSTFLIIYCKILHFTTSWHLIFDIVITQPCLCI